MKKQKIVIFVFFCFLLVLTPSLFAISLLNINNYPSQVSPGNNIKISMSVKNTLNQDISNVNVKLNLEDVPFAPYESGSERFIDNIRDGRIENIEFNLIALPSASSGIYKIPVEIKYEKEDDSIITKSELISVTINSNPEIKITLEDSPLIKGKENVLGLKIINSGLSDIKFSYITLTDSSGFQFLSNKEQYLGDIDSNDFDIADFNVYIDSNAPDFTFLKVTIKYRDATNEQFTEVKQIPIKTFSKKEAQDIGLIAKPNYIIYFIILIILIAYFTRKSLKKRKKNRR